MIVAILLTPWLSAIGNLWARKISLRVTVRGRSRSEDVHTVIGKAFTSWSPIHTIPHVNGRWTTCEWEGDSQGNGSMQGGSGVNGRVITCDRKVIMRDEGTITCDAGMIMGDLDTNHM
jgi:hypothetical protein